jgi:hypothetical protein
MESIPSVLVEEYLQGWQCASSLSVKLCQRPRGQAGLMGLVMLIRVVRAHIVH